MKKALPVPPLLPRGSFTGVPGHFRGWCDTASQRGNSGGYRLVGRQFGRKLLGYVPHDLSDDEWLSLVDQMEKKLLREDTDWQGLAVWLRRYFPLMMRLIPRDEFDSFLAGVRESYDEGEMMEDFPAGFQPVEVNLEDPCEGEGFIRIVYHHPVPREVVYQCPAPGCRKRSRAFIEQYAAENNLPIVDLGGSIATVQELGDK